MAIASDPAELAQERRREQIALVGAWLFVLSDTVALVALIATMLVLGGTWHGDSAAPAMLGGLATMACTSLCLQLAKKRRSKTYARLGLALVVAFLILQLAFWMPLLAAGAANLDEGAERVLVMVAFAVSHALVLASLLAIGVFRRRTPSAGLCVFCHYLTLVWLVVVALYLGAWA